LTRNNSIVSGRAARLLKIQFTVGLILGTFFLIYSGTFDGLSAFYGALIAISSTLLLRRGVNRANDLALTEPKKSMGVLYFGAVQRFVLVLALLIIGLGILKLQALPVLSGFVLAQLGFLFNVRDRSEK